MFDLTKPRPVVWRARWLILAGMGLGAVGGFGAATLWWRGTVSTLEERISLFQIALQVLTPEQADKQVTALWSSLQATNRRLTKMETTGSIGPGKLPTLPDRTFPVWVHVAFSEIGQTAIPGPHENPRISEYFKAVVDSDQTQDDQTEWASAFVEWSLNSVGIQGPKSLWPLAWTKWGRIIKQPEPGCIVMFSYRGVQHVAFYIEEDGDFIKVLGGNENDSVNISRYPKSAVVAYRMPSVPEETTKH